MIKKIKTYDIWCSLTQSKKRYQTQIFFSHELKIFLYQKEFSLKIIHLEKKLRFD